MAHVEITYEHRRGCTMQGKRFTRRYVVQPEDGTFEAPVLRCGLPGSQYAEMAIVGYETRGASHE